jgi:hypothetical protein
MIDLVFWSCFGRHQLVFEIPVAFLKALVFEKPKNAPNMTVNKTSTFAKKNLKILKLLHGPIFHILWEKYLFFLKNVLR